MSPLTLTVSPAASPRATPHRRPRISPPATPQPRQPRGSSPPALRCATRWPAPGRSSSAPQLRHQSRHRRPAGARHSVDGGPSPRGLPGHDSRAAADRAARRPAGRCGDLPAAAPAPGGAVRSRVGVFTPQSALVTRRCRSRARHRPSGREDGHVGRLRAQRRGVTQPSLPRRAGQTRRAVRGGGGSAFLSAQRHPVGRGAGPVRLAGRAAGQRPSCGREAAHDVPRHAPRLSAGPGQRDARGPQLRGRSVGRSPKAPTSRPARSSNARSPTSSSACRWRSRSRRWPDGWRPRTWTRSR